MFEFSHSFLSFNRSRSESFDDMFLEKQRDDKYRACNSNRRRHESGPVDFGIRNKFKDGGRERFGFSGTQNQREYKIVPGKNK
jgi:hypothetical protein